MKISELQNSEIKDFCGISDDDSDRIIEIMKSSAKAFIMGYPLNSSNKNMTF